MAKYSIVSAGLIVLDDRKFVRLFLVLSAAFFGLFLYIPIRSIPGNSLEMQLSISRFQDLFLLAILSFLTSLSIIMNIYMLKNKSGKSPGLHLVGQAGIGGMSGIIASMFGTLTCGLCITSILSFLSATSIVFLIQNKDLITVAAIILMFISLYITSRKLLGFCKECNNLKYEK